MNTLAPFTPATKNVASDPRRDFAALAPRSAPSGSADDRVQTYVFRPAFAKDHKTAVGPQPSATTFEERIFDALVSLKVSISTFAMHLNSEERRRLFEQLDDTINVDDWHEGDNLPSKESFQQFLKWMIYSRNVDWTSLGVSQAGTILVAWRKPTVLLTADFEGNSSVRWTARLTGDDDEIGHTAGRCSLKLFAEQAQFYLRR